MPRGTNIRKPCLRCGSFNTKRHDILVLKKVTLEGVKPQGIQRWYCKDCRRPFTPERPANEVGTYTLDVYYYAGMIEQWGSGIRMMLAECKTATMPAPAFEQVQGFRVTFRKATEQVPDKHRTSTAQVPHKAPECYLSLEERKVLKACNKPKSIKELMALLGLKHRIHFLQAYIHPLLKEGLIAMTAPGAPTSPRQKYATTEKGSGLIQSGVLRNE